MGGLQVVKVRFMNPDGLLQLLDILRPALSESRLGLAVPLLPLLGSGIYLNGIINQRNSRRGSSSSKTYRLAAALPLWQPDIVWIVRVIMNLMMVLEGSRIGLGRRAHGVI
jgi:hypothetical protein